MRLDPRFRPSRQSEYHTYILHIQTEEKLRLGNNCVWGANRAQIDIYLINLERDAPLNITIAPQTL
eukprot:scaffold16453_cov77-Skeletonema_dohrnii-CCMP3373.AAC.2